MKKIFLFCLLHTFFIKGQNCSPTNPPTNTFYQNSTSNYTISNSGIIYLCGPNTVVYDTSYSGGCISYLNSGTVLNLKNSCTFAHIVYMKNNSTLNVLPGTGGLVFIYYENGAIINNPFNLLIDSDYCALITLPAANCIATSIIEKEYQDRVVFFPNPVQDFLTLSVNLDLENNFKYLFIRNAIGQLVREEEVNFKNNKATLNTTYLPNGIYYLNLNGINKRFFIAR